MTSDRGSARAGRDRRASASARALAGLALCVAAGCGDDPSLVVVTTWDEAACRAILKEFGDDPPAVDPAGVRWFRVDPWVDPGRLLGGGRRVDVLLGWTAEDLGPAVVADLDLATAVVIDRSVPVGSSPGSATLGGATGRPLPTGDPRIDPRSRSLIREQLAVGPWIAAYRRLILLAAGSEQGMIGDEPAGLPASIERPELAVDVSGRVEAGRFLRSLRAVEGTRPVDGAGPTGGLSILEAELLGATAVDAGPELRRAWAARRGRGDPAVEAALIAEPPPWPPASIVGLREGDEGETLLETLAGALVRDGEARAWLLTSWRSPSRPIDGGLLRELATAGGGALLREPLFLAWLRAEWTAWARQHYAGRAGRSS